MRRWIATHFAEEVARERVTVPRGPVDAGSEAQIDYGRLGMWFDPATARRVAVWAFVMVLAFSRHLFVRPVIRMDQTAWCACHVAAFEFFDGVPARLVCDNLRTGVDKPDLYDPQINRSYAELASHYATLVDPARARKPKDKPRVERPMTYVRDSFWKGREFDSLAQMQQAAVTWSTEVAGLRYLRALEGAQPLRMFEAVEQQALIALPPRAFELTSWSIGTVGVDTHLKVGKALYSVPWRLIGQRLHARTAGDVVQIFAGNDVVATHVRRPSGRSTDFSGEDRLPHAHPDLVSTHRRTGRPSLPASDRRIHARQRHPPPTVGPRRARATRQTRLRPAGGRLRPRHRGRRPELSHHQGHPCCRHRTRRQRADHQ